MEYSRPSLKELSSRMQSDLARELGATAPFKRTSIISALSHSLSGALHLIYGKIDSIEKQLFVESATARNLDRLALTLGTNRRGRTSAHGVVRMTGNPGQKVLKGALLTHIGSAKSFTVTKDNEIDESRNALISISANTLGSDGNLKADEQLVLNQSIKGINEIATVLNPGIAEGFEEETDDLLRARLRLRLKHPGQGGSSDDYKWWAQEIPGVGNVWIFPPKDLAITILFLTIDPSFPIPSESLANKVSDHLRQRKPLGTRVVILAPDPKSINISIQVSREIVNKKDRVEKFLKNYFLREVAPGQRITVYTLLQVLQRFTRTEQVRILEPTADVTLSAYQIAVFGGLKCTT
jgi:uncharacterized phage protein gp47/JayE